MPDKLECRMNMHKTFEGLQKKTAAHLNMPVQKW